MVRECSLPKPSFKLIHPYITSIVGKTSLNNVWHHHNDEWIHIFALQRGFTHLFNSASGQSHLIWRRSEGGQGTREEKSANINRHTGVTCWHWLNVLHIYPRFPRHIEMSLLTISSSRSSQTPIRVPSVLTRESWIKFLFRSGAKNSDCCVFFWTSLAPLICDFCIDRAASRFVVRHVLNKIWTGSAFRRTVSACVRQPTTSV